MYDFLAKDDNSKNILVCNSGFHDEVLLAFVSINLAFNLESR
ncbi:hypothetical protein CPS_3351 [Colwellia psychrerythraea 34H]|uniref:Uncharacterized protein n=1 Tax=Colwellia psychrerythraea (strain 34H / ATCC BAA-681) TaxID=167879 RepID=Q47YU3_COLP3|nr:hypothetical protein CPS_3351 [Colwellia psychrerythraea 34H]